MAGRLSDTQLAWLMLPLCLAAAYAGRSSTSCAWGPALEPEAAAPPFGVDESYDDVFDGDVKRDGRSYEELKHLLFHARPIRSAGA